MAEWTEKEAAVCRSLVQLALAEDLNEVGDLTSQALLPEELQGRAVIVARAAGVLAGLPALRMVYEAIDPQVQIETLSEDGQQVRPDQVVAAVHGKLRAILTGERTALNFLQRLSGVATLTRRYVDAVAGLPCRILDTRKTTPGWRLLEKYAVRCGGGSNHRMGLFDGVLIKDNHLAALVKGEGQRIADAIPKAVQAACQRWGRAVPVEVEVDTLEQLDVALAAGPDIILLDNMDLDILCEAVRRRNQIAPGIQLEASGGITLATVRAVAETGVDCISIGTLTHSAPALDISLDYS